MTTSTRHHPIARVTHCVSAVALAVMAASGMRIFNARHFSHEKVMRHSRGGHGRGRRSLRCSRLGAWLGGARHWHFAMMWLLVANALVYLVHLFRHGRWRTIVPRANAWRDAIEMARFDLYAWKDHPVQGKHNAALGRWWHFSVRLALAALMLIHVILVLTVEPYAIRAMTTGRYDEDRWSPGARDARPLSHLLRHSKKP